MNIKAWQPYKIENQRLMVWPSRKVLFMFSFLLVWWWLVRYLEVTALCIRRFSPTATMPKWKSSYDSNRKYNPNREKQFVWQKKGGHGEAFCKLCNCSIAPRQSNLHNYEKAVKHKYKFWRNIFVWLVALWSVLLLNNTVYSISWSKLMKLNE